MVQQIVATVDSNVYPLSHEFQGAVLREFNLKETRLRAYKTLVSRPTARFGGGYH